MELAPPRSLPETRGRRVAPYAAVWGAGGRLLECGVSERAVRARLPVRVPVRVCLSVGGACVRVRLRVTLYACLALSRRLEAVSSLLIECFWGPG